MTRPGSFSKPTKRAALARAAGICECARVPQLMVILHGKPCGARLGTGNVFYEHVTPLELGGDDSLDNCAALTRTCWRLKTDIYDLAAIALAKRREDSHHAIAGPGRGARPMRGGRNTPESIGIGGGIKRRRTLAEKLVDAGVIRKEVGR